MVTTDLPPIEALSKPTIIVLEIYLGKVGTQRIFPFLAIICKRILVAIDCTFFFEIVP